MEEIIVPGMRKYDGSYPEKMARERREEARARVEQGELIPGYKKNSPKYEERTIPNPLPRDKALSDTRVVDNEYDYTKVKWPGKMETNLDLDRGETMQIKHRPQINDDTNR